MIFGFLKKKEKDFKPEGKPVGSIVHYFGNCKAGIIKLKAPLSIGDIIHLYGHTTNFKQKVSSMQINCKDVQTATRPKEVGVLMKKRVRQKDMVYKVD